jgi:thiol:disulfide interchange protein
LVNRVEIKLEKKDFPYYIVAMNGKKAVSIIILVLMPLLLLGAQSFNSASMAQVDINSFFESNQKGQAVIEVNYSIPSNLHQIDNRDFFKFTVDSEDWELIRIIYPGPVDYGDFTGWEGEISLKGELRFKGDRSDLESISEISIKAFYQLCDDKGICLRPEQRELDSQISQGLLGQDSSLSSTGKGVLLFLLFAFLGGIILNIMPCVLPVLSIKAMHLIQQSGDNKKKILLNSFSYAGGILFSMLILGGLVMAIKASGTLLGWGFQFQNPPFVLILTSLVLLFGLSLFEVFFINPPQAAGKVAGKQNSHGYLGSFVTGIMAVLLATPCTAPLLGSALGFAFSQSGGIILVFFSLIGLGLALPFILLGFFPAIVNKLPKPGEWMNRFREIMGFLLMGTVIYLLTILHGQLGSGFRGIMWFLLILSFSAWLYGRSQRSGRRLRIIFLALSLLIAGTGGVIFIDLNNSDTALGQAQNIDKEKITFSPELVEQYRSAGQPLFLEFSADWCATCRTNHLTVLDRDFRRDLFSEQGIVYMVGDYTRNDPVISQWLADFERAGVPLYVYYAPGKEPVVLPEILTRSILEKAIQSE